MFLGLKVEGFSTEGNGLVKILHRSEPLMTSKKTGGKMI